MNKESTTALCYFMFAFLILQTAYMHYLKTGFTLKDGRYEQIGVMKFTDNGADVFIPVFKRTN